MNQKMSNQEKLELIAKAELEPEILSVLVQRHRERLSNLVLNRCCGLVIDGPFMGLNISGPDWGHSFNDRASMALGLYEQEVQAELARPRSKRTNLINLGAADGFYALGMLFSGLSRSVFVFESNEAATSNIKNNALRNNINLDLIKFNKTATPDFFKFIDPELAGDSIILSDIEGAEFEIFTKSHVFEYFKHSPVIIEIHERPGVNLGLASIIRASCITHLPSMLTTGPRDLSKFDFLAAIDDSSRWLLVSETRPYRMSWLLLQPYESRAQ